MTAKTKTASTAAPAATTAPVEKVTKATKPAATPAPAKVVDAAPAKVVEAAPAKVVEAAPAKKTASKKTSAKETAPAPVVAAPAPAPTVAHVEAPAPAASATPVVTETVADTEDAFAPRFATLLDTLALLTNQVRELTGTVRTLQKDHNRFVRENVKRNAKRQSKTKRVASGFAKPTLLSDEMYSFLGIEKGTQVVRNDVTHRINDYVVKNNLRDETDKRNIIPNDVLRKLLALGDGDKLTYFNIQKYLKHHFVKPATA